MRTTNTYRLPRRLTGAVGGSIHPKLDDWNRQNPKAHVGDFAKVAEFGELVQLGETPGHCQLNGGNPDS
jgi:hypothetical protein